MAGEFFNGDRENDVAILKCVANVVDAVEMSLLTPKPYKADDSATPTDEELKHIDLAAAKLWDLDVNRLSPGEDYVINPQRATRVGALGEGLYFLHFAP